MGMMGEYKVTVLLFLAISQIKKKMALSRRIISATLPLGINLIGFI